ncbi:MAG TPA: Hpt domain-containing protein [Gammaproteobacteria bacterium]|nr:Hpt domain-containing protein [Gammaproteobacteria bacterium]
MNPAALIDYGTLKWVKGEMDQSLAEARHALEAFVLNPHDSAQMRFCVTHLHQVHGILQMIELYGAAMLAEEMEHLAEALAREEIQQRDDAYEVLMRAILQLPNYLERLQSGHQQDTPLVLLPLLNDLRAARGQNLLSQGALFAPDLSIAPPARPALELVAQGQPDIRAVARRERSAYQRNLVSWYRTPAAMQHLKELNKVIQRLDEASSQGAVVQLWWVTHGLIEALLENGLEPRVSVKLLLGQVDRQIKRLIDGGEEELITHPPRELLKNMLYYVAQATSAGTRVLGLKYAFDLDALLPREDEIEQARSSLAGPNLELLRTVSAVIREDLSRVKDSLDIFVRSELPVNSELQSLEEPLRQIADTVGMLGLGLARKRILDQVNRLKEMVQGDAPVNEVGLMEMAGALLYVESSLDALGKEEPRSAEIPGAMQSGASPGPADSEDLLTSAEYRQLFSTVVKEIKADLSRVKESITAFIVTPMQHHLLVRVPALLNQIIGALQIVSETRSAEILSDCKERITEDLIEHKIIPSQHQLDNLADVISSVEYYLEALDEGRSDREVILNMAQQSMRQLSFTDAGEQPPTAAKALAPSDLFGEAHALVADEVSAPALESIELPQAAGIEAEDSTEPEPPEVAPGVLPPVTLVEPFAAALSYTSEQVEVAPPSTLTTPAARPADIDDEIIEIFLEEAGEEMDTIAAHFPVWQQNPENHETLSVLRRSFHTLKGSGRMVGATAIGEFAWSFENMLNRVIDNTVPAHQAIIDLVERAQAALPQLVEHFRGGAPPTLDIQAMMDQAKAMSQPGSLAAPQPIETPASLAPVVQLPSDSASLSQGVVVPVSELPAANEALPPDDVQGSTDVAGGRTPGATPLSASGAPLIHAEPPAPEVPPAAADVQGRAAAKGSTNVAGGRMPGATTPEVVVRPAREVEPQMDTLLLEIFGKEAAGHLDKIQTFIDQCIAQDSDVQGGTSVAGGRAPGATECRVTDALSRTLHTLHGSASMAGVPDIAAPAGLLEKYVKSLSANQTVITPHIIDLFRRAIAFTKETIAALKDPKFSWPSNTVLMADISALYEVELAHQLSAIEVAPGFLPPATLVEPFAAALPYTSQERPAPAEMNRFSEPAAAEKDSEVIEVFLEEGKEILEACEITLQQWSADPSNKDLMEELQRQLHTLKGGARMAAIPEMGDLSHSLESLITMIVDGHLPVSSQLSVLMQQTQDRLLQMLDLAAANRPIPPAPELIAHIQGLIDGHPSEHPPEQPDTAPAPVKTVELEPVAEQPDGVQGSINVAGGRMPEATELVTYRDVLMSREAGHQERPAAPAEALAEQEEFEPTEEEHRQLSRIQHEQIRVRADLLDNMVNFAGEISISRSRLEQQIGSFKYNLSEMDQVVARLRAQLRKLEIETEAQILFRYAETGRQDEEFDPLEFDRFSSIQQLSRSLIEGVNDLENVEGQLQNLTRESETLLLQQSRINTDLQQGLMSTRMVQFAVVLPRLRRIVRQVAHDVGKQVELRVFGAEVETDRTVLDRIVPSLEHLLRNAVDHGVEPAKARRAAGKSETGTITLSVERQGTDIVIRISDDGAGLNVAAIRKKAQERSLLSKSADMTDNEVIQFILEPGFSTASEITQISGRGVGMDVVNSEVKQLGGMLDIGFKPGQGTTFTLRLPLSLSVNQALLVHVGEDVYAIPLTSIERITRVTHEELEEFHAQPGATYKMGGRGYTFMHLGTLLGTAHPYLPGPRRKLPMLMMRAGDHYVTLQVEAIMGSREIVVKSVGPQISTVRGITGATILGDGRVVLILDIPALVRLGMTRPTEQAVAEPVVTASTGIMTVMVVDDSITVRKVTTRLLERHNIRVLAAKDGVDAVALLQEHIPDVMLLDIEMPRMDGYELATLIRNEPRLKHIPIIMITSRTGEKHRERAMQIGVNSYMGKPYQESELLKNIDSLVGGRIATLH